MIRLPFALILSALVFGADNPASKYRTETGSAAPAELPETVRAAIASQSIAVLTAGERYLEFWPAVKSAAAAKEEETGASLGRLQHGAFFGVLRVAKGVNDRRGDRMAPGLYVLRLSFHPVDGSHQGIAPQRDFLVLTSAATDNDPAAAPAFADLMKAAQNASGSNHPFSLSCWKQDQGFAPGLHAEGEQDVVLHIRVADIPLAIIIAGRYEG